MTTKKFATEPDQGSPTQWDVEAAVEAVSSPLALSPHEEEKVESDAVVTAPTANAGASTRTPTPELTVNEPTLAPPPRLDVMLGVAADMEVTVCRLLLGSAEDNLDEIIDQFKGQEDELIEALQAIQARATAQKATAVQSNDTIVDEEMGTGAYPPTATAGDGDEPSGDDVVVLSFPPDIAFGLLTVATQPTMSDRPHYIPPDLYDPITQFRMVDPVVNIAGDSYERLALFELLGDSSDFGSLYYPNRALESILKQQAEHEEQQRMRQEKNGTGNETEASPKADSFAEPPPTLLHLARIGSSSSTRNLASQRRVVQKWYYAGRDDSANDALLTLPTRPPLPDAFYCPITCDIMVDPWIGPDGVTYEYNAICEWIRAAGGRRAVSPVTREALALDQFRPNHALYSLIQWEVNSLSHRQEERHVGIQAWIDSTPCTQRRPRGSEPQAASSFSLPVQLQQQHEFAVATATAATNEQNFVATRQRWCNFIWYWLWHSCVLVLVVSVLLLAVAPKAWRKPCFVTFGTSLYILAIPCWCSWNASGNSAEQHDMADDEPCFTLQCCWNYFRALWWRGCLFVTLTALLLFAVVPDAWEEPLVTAYILSFCGLIFTGWCNCYTPPRRSRRIRHSGGGSMNEDRGNTSA